MTTRGGHSRPRQNDGYGARQERLEVSPKMRAYRHGVSPRSAGRGQGTPRAGPSRTACRRTESALRDESVGLAVGHAGGTTLGLETSVVPQNGAPEHHDRITGGELLERGTIGISLLVKACGLSCWLESRSGERPRAGSMSRSRTAAGRQSRSGVRHRPHCSQAPQGHGVGRIRQGDRHVLKPDSQFETAGACYVAPPRPRGRSDEGGTE